MIYNKEQDNQIEGTYLIALEVAKDFSWVKVNLPDDFYIDHSNVSDWVLGFGMKKPYYDAGVENIFEIEKIENDTIYLNNQFRGVMNVIRGQKLCFWNKNSSGFKKYHAEELIKPSMFKGYHGNSIGFSSVVFDSVSSSWITLLNEVDNDTIAIYASSSNDLHTWKSENDSLAVMTAADFENTWWAGFSRDGQSPQTPVVYDIIRANNKWVLFCDGYDSLGKRHIGTITTIDLVNGPFVISKDPVIQSGFADWCSNGVFFSKVEPYLDGYIMFFVGESQDKTEYIGKASSNNLTQWQVHNKAVIDDHIGWRSFPTTASPNWIEIKDSTIYLLTSGTKNFMYGKKNNRVLSEYGMGVSGNVGDAQLGVYKSVDGGSTFETYRNNPVFTNNYADTSENQHMGGNFEYIKKENKEYVIYQAKTTNKGHRYAIYIRERIIN